MKRFGIPAILAALGAAAGLLVAQPEPAPEAAAIRYLAGEVARWPVENGCFSCHNNGDAARALYLARRLGYSVPESAIGPTTAWLRNPAGWDEGEKEAVFKDRKLGRIQFAAALAALPGRSGEAALAAAGDLLVELQEADGHWAVDSASAAGSPATYGPAVATWLARRALEAAGDERFRDPAARAAAWLAGLEPRSVPDAAAILMGSGPNAPNRSRSRELLLAAQAPGGGWGPFRNSPSEPYDTALGVIALSLHGVPECGRCAGAVKAGRDYLARTQLETGGWPETTRPPGGQSYAQHISTSAWAALALLVSDPERDRDSLLRQPF